MTQQVYNIATMIGMILSLIGLVVALAQIRKTLTAAKAAERSSTATEYVIVRNIFLTDVSSCVTAIEEIKVLIRSTRYEAALLRVTDLNANMIRIHHLPNAPADTSQIRFKAIFAQLAILRELLEQRLHSATTDVNPVNVNSVLSQISDQLNHWIGGAKYDYIAGESRK